MHIHAAARDLHSLRRLKKETQTKTPQTATVRKGSRVKRDSEDKRDKKKTKRQGIRRKNTLM